MAREQGAGFRIREVVELTGIARNTLLAWERRYSVVQPARSENGYRTYSQQEVDTLLHVKRLVDKGVRVGEAVRRVTGEVLPKADTSMQLESLYERILLSLLDFEREEADRLVHQSVLLPFNVLIDQIYAPILQRVGDMWAQGEVSVAQEHFVSAFCREQLIGMFHQVAPGPKSGKVVLCSGYPGEQHEMGLLIVSIKLALSGFKVMYLGANLPPEDLIRTLRKQKVELVCQSVMRQHPYDEIIENVLYVRDSLPEPRPLMVLGGPGVRGITTQIEGVKFFADYNAFAQWIEPPTVRGLR